MSNFKDDNHPTIARITLRLFERISCNGIKDSKPRFRPERGSREMPSYTARHSRRAGEDPKGADLYGKLGQHEGD
jgi:hypothetical protein